METVFSYCWLSLSILNFKRKRFSYCSIVKVFESTKEYAMCHKS